MDWLINIPDWLSLLFGGSIISIVTWRFARRKAAAEAKEAEARANQAEAEAKKAEAEALKEKQDYYQQMLENVAADRDYYKQDRDDTRDKLDKLSRSVIDWKRETDLTIDELRRQVFRNGRQIEAMRPLLCADLGCKNRKRVAISEGVESKPTEATAEPTDVEPINQKDM